MCMLMQLSHIINSMYTNIPNHSAFSFSTVSPWPAPIHFFDICGHYRGKISSDGSIHKTMLSSFELSTVTCNEDNKSS